MASSGGGGCVVLCCVSVCGVSPDTEHCSAEQPTVESVGVCSPCVCVRVGLRRSQACVMAGQGG